MFFAKFAAAAMVVMGAGAGVTALAVPAGASTAPAVHRGISGGGSSAVHVTGVTITPRSCTGNPHGCPA
jgi:hypothetical protein